MTVTASGVASTSSSSSTPPPNRAKAPGTSWMWYRTLLSFLIIPAIGNLIWGFIKINRARKIGVSATRYLVPMVLSVIIALTVGIGGAVLTGSHSGSNTALVPSAGQPVASAPVVAPTTPSATDTLASRLDAIKAILRSETFTAQAADGTRTTTNKYDQIEIIPDKAPNGIYDVMQLIDLARDQNQPTLLKGAFADVSSTNALYQEFVQALPVASTTPGARTGLFAPPEVNDLVVDSAATGKFTANVFFGLRSWHITVEPIDGMWVISQAS